jgi:hypothetical protein
MNHDSANRPPRTVRLWNERTVLSGILILSSVLFLILAFGPP